MAEYYTKLVCTFLEADKQNYILKKIYNSFNVENSKAFLFKDMSQDNKLLVTYNILIPKDIDRKDFQISQRVRNTIFIHRNKNSNSLYTIDGLNEAVKIQNNGQIDIKFPLDWSKYQNQIILEREGALHSVPIEFLKIINLKKIADAKDDYNKNQSRSGGYNRPNYGNTTGGYNNNWNPRDHNRERFDDKEENWDDNEN